MSTSSFWRPYRRHVVCYLLIVAAACFSISQIQSEPKKAPAYPSIILAETAQLEASLQEKAEKVLRGFGESDPVAVITVEVQSGYLHRESYEVNPEKTAIDSQQTTVECMNDDKANKAQMMAEADSSRSSEDNRKYFNRKESTNHLVTQSKTKFESRYPQMKRVSCMIQISEDNETRSREIEHSLWLALGMKAERGDAVKAFVQ